MKTPQLIEAAFAVAPRDFSQGIVVDNFAGGGGASTGLEAALLRDVPNARITVEVLPIGVQTQSEVAEKNMP